MRYRISILLLIVALGMSAQEPARKYKWKQLGPISTAYTETDIGNYTAVGMGWVEDVWLGEKYWYAAAMTGGLYRSRNEGKSWKKIDSDTIQLGTLCLWESADTLYRGTGLTHFGDRFGVGLLYSADWGKTWGETDLKFSKNEKKPLWDVASDQNQWVACTPHAIYTSQNGVRGWTKVYEEPNTKLWEVHAEFGKLWAVGDKVLRSDDGGKTWIELSSNLSVSKSGKNEVKRISVAIDPNDENRVLAFYGYKGKGTIDESKDGGATWKNLYSNRKIARADRHHTEISFAGESSDVVIVGTFRAYMSLDGGLTFTTSTAPKKYASNFAHDDIRGLYSAQSDNILLATDGGVFQSLDTGKTWINKSGKGLTLTQIYGMHQLADGSILIGCQDLGYFIYKEKKWTHLGNYYGDGGDALETGEGVKVLIGGIMKTIDMSKRKGAVYSHPPVRHNPFRAKFYRYPESTDSFFYTGRDLWFYANGTYTNMTEDIEGKLETVSGFDINPKKPNQLFFSYSQPTWDVKNMKDKFHRSMDGGVTWEDITHKIPVLAWHYIVSISSSPDDPNEVVVCLGLMDSDQLHKVYKSIDGGDTWENISEGLPPYETFQIEHIGTSGLLLASLGGMYYTNDKLGKWIKLKGKLPPIAARDFEINIIERRLYVATYGAGLWSMKIPKKMLRY